MLQRRTGGAPAARFRVERGNLNAIEDLMALQLYDLKGTALVELAELEEERKVELRCGVEAAALGLRGGSSGELRG